MLNRDIDSIIYQSYIKLGSLTYQISKDADDGLVGDASIKEMWRKALIIYSVLDVIEDSIVVQNNSVYQIRGITEQEMNKLLSLLIGCSGIFDFPVAPFIPVKDISQIIINNGLPGLPGNDGTSSYTSIVFASDTMGTGLSATPDPSLPYIAFKSSSSPIPFLPASFVGLWVKFVGADGPSALFVADILVSLSGGKTMGKYLTGQTIPAIGKTPEQVIRDIAIEYINPVFTGFSISGQSGTIEIGTTLSGSKTFLWSITLNSGVVPTIDIYDITGALTLLSGTANDGTQVQAITTIQLNSNGSVQSWKGIGHNTTPSGTFDSVLFTVIARYLRFYGPTSATVNNSATTRALPISTDFQVPGANTFILNTGTLLTKFNVALPPSVTITSVFDLDNLNANITSFYVLLGTVTVNDAGGTPRTYNLYEMSVGVSYSLNSRHSITTS